MLWRGGVQRGFRREMLSGPEILVPVTALNPLSGRSLCGPCAHQFRYLLLALTGSGIDIVCAIGGIQQVDMGIDEAGKDGSALEINDLLRCPGGPHTPHLVVAADGENAPAYSIDSHSLRVGLLDVHCIKIAIHIGDNAHVLCLSSLCTKYSAHDLFVTTQELFRAHALLALKLQLAHDQQAGTGGDT